jgi:hypothetical protein
MGLLYATSFNAANQSDCTEISVMPELLIGLVSKKWQP